MDESTIEQLIAEMSWVRRLAQDLVRDHHPHARHDADEAINDSQQVFTSAELVERVALRRAIADEVLALHEPYRSTVLLHFLSGISDTDLAPRLRISVDCVRERLKCAFEQLWVALCHRSDQPNRGWIAALVRFANSPLYR